MRPHLLALASASLSFAFVACDGRTEDTDAQRSEATSITPGAGVDSAYADRQKRYLSRRMLGPLRQVGALDDFTFGLADRLRQLAPADADLTLAKLASAEREPIASRLTPAEKAALPKLWTAFEVGTEVDEVVAVPSLEERIVRADVPHQPIDPSASIRVSALPAAMQNTAQRIELGNDADGDASTVSIADVRTVSAAPGGFTADEVKQFGPILDAIAVAQPATGRIAREVPIPGLQDHAVMTVAGVEIHVRELITYLETRRTPPDHLEIEVRPRVLTHGFFARAPADTHVLVTLMTDTGGDFELDSRPASLRSLTFSVDEPQLTDASRPVLVQVYAGQRRVGARVVKLPEIRKEAYAARVDMGTELLVGGTALKRAIWSSGPHAASERDELWGFWTYEVDPAHPTSRERPGSLELAPFQLAKLESVPIRAAIGDYRVPFAGFGSIDLHVYRNSLVTVTYGGQTATVPFERNRYGELYSTWMYVGTTLPPMDVRLNPATSELSVRKHEDILPPPWITVAFDGRYRR